MSAALLVAMLIAGKITLSALGIADWVVLAQAGITVARLGIMVGAKVEQRIGKLPHHPPPRYLPRRTEKWHVYICWRGAPSGQSVWVCEK